MERLKILVLFLALALLAAIPAAGSQQERVDVYENQKLVKSVVFAIGLDEYFVNGQTPGYKMDAAPFIENDRTFVPVRYLGYALGLTPADVSWDNASQKATLRRGPTVLEMTIGVPEVVTNGQAKAIDVAPILKSEPAWRTYLPARFVAEGLGYEVDWDRTTQTVICWPKDEQKPDVRAVQEYVREQVLKPETVRELDSMFGVSSKPSGSSWMYNPPREETFRNRDKSYFIYWVSPDGTIGVAICWDMSLPDIRNVQLDLSPIEKVLAWRFPDQPDAVKEMIDYAWQVAEKTRSSNGFERLPWRDYQVGGCKVKVGSVGGNLVGVIIKKS